MSGKPTLVETRLTLKPETDNKLRWSGDVLNVAFKLYVPKATFRGQIPEVLLVSVVVEPALLADGSRRQDDNSLFEVVRKVEEHTETVRYCPTGAPDRWLIGEPYIPKTLLSEQYPERVGLRVRWE
jgi:hypothetical protein